MEKLWMTFPNSSASLFWALALSIWALRELDSDPKNFSISFICPSVALSVLMRSKVLFFWMLSEPGTEDPAPDGVTIMGLEICGELEGGECLGGIGELEESEGLDPWGRVGGGRLGTPTFLCPGVEPGRVGGGRDGGAPVGTWRFKEFIFAF